MTEDKRKEEELPGEDVVSGGGVLPQPPGKPTLYLPTGSKLTPLRVVPDKRQNAVPERKYSFETPPAPVPARSIKETVATEVVVVGGGISGISAALSAAEAGAGVILIEKMPTYQNRGADNGFVGSRLQKKLGIEINTDELILQLMKYAANKPDQRLLRLWAAWSGKCADWLLDMTDAAGLEVSISHHPLPDSYDAASEYYPAYLSAHQFDQRKMVGCLLDNAVRKGVDVRFNIRAEQLLREGNGRVTGVVAKNKDGDYIQFNAKKAVVLCTGDYSYNDDMMAKYCPPAAYLASKLRTSTGDGHLMAMWAGAVMEPAPHAPMTHGFAGPLGNAPFLQVNTVGERFQNEDVPSQSYTNAVERQPGQVAWQVFDAGYPEELPAMGIGHGKINRADDEMQQAVKSVALQADTIEELGEKMGVPVETFKATVARYNELARQGKDLDFGKRPDRLTTVEKPPYYAGKGGYEMLVVMGGINVNTRLQPLDADWKVIPGLYAGGNVIGNRFAVDYPLICPGISHGMALTFGRIAGTNAATLEP
jgi:fumarate reductase flavoprotein subunit